MKTVLIATLSLLFTSSAFAVQQRSFKCDLKKLNVKSERISIKCAYNQSFGNKPYVQVIKWYSTTFEQANTQKMLELLTVARALNKPVRIFHQDGPEGNPAGCLGGNCRKLIAVSF